MMGMDFGSLAIELVVYFTLQKGPHFQYFATNYHRTDFAFQMVHFQMGFEHHHHCLVVAIAVSFAPNWPIDCLSSCNSSYAFFHGQPFFNLIFIQILPNQN